MATIYFDLDGTLIDVRRRHYAAYANTLGELELTPLLEAEYWCARRHGASSAQLLGQADDGTRAGFLEGWLARVERPDYLRIDTLMPGAAYALDELDGRYDLVLVTLRRDARALAQQIERLGLGDRFAAVLCRADARGADSKIGLLRSYGAAIERDDVIVGDSEADIEAARTLGLRSVCVTNGVRDDAYLRRLQPDILVQGVAHVATALACTRQHVMTRNAP
jgi:phosphoglycolate phosphatase-like HAD superfamily hydrolase